MLRHSRHSRLPKLLVTIIVVMAAVWMWPATSAAETPKWGFSELRFGLYYPSLDDEEGLTGTPFEDRFGTNNRLMFEYELGFHLLQGFGKFGVSASAGYTAFNGNAQIVGDPSDDERERISETTDLKLVPIRASAYYRFDVLSEEWSIPFVPVAKGGIDYFLWRVEDGSDSAAEFDGDEAKGGKFGYHVSFGLHFLLDIIDPQSAASFDLNWGVNNTYLFAEYMLTRVDGFGSEGFDFSDNQWIFGLSFEF